MLFIKKKKGEGRKTMHSINHEPYYVIAFYLPTD